jgi:hypothetical protein
MVARVLGFGSMVFVFLGFAIFIFFVKIIFVDGWLKHLPTKIVFFSQAVAPTTCKNIDFRRHLGVGGSPSRLRKLVLTVLKI